MKLRIPLLLLIIIAFINPFCAQNNKSWSLTSNDEISYHYQEGIKMNSIHDTPLLLTNLNDEATGNTPNEMALNWINNNKELLKIRNTADLTVRFTRSSLSGHTIRFQQSFNNIPVYQSEVVVHISPKNKITYVYNTFNPTIKDCNTFPTILKENAFQLAQEEIKVSGRISFSENKLFIYQKNQTGTIKLVYRVIIEAEIPIGSWEVLVDAQNGEIISAMDKAFYNKEKEKDKHPHQKTVVNGTGNVFIPDPLSFANVTYAGNYVDNGDATNAQLDAATSNVMLLDIDLTAGTYKLKGPYAEIQDFEAPNKGLFTQATNTFNFNRFDDAFEAVNCYFIIDQSMRYINQTLGIPLMPYQYATGVRYDPHGLSGADNSHYIPSSGRLAFGEGGVDDAEDADVIIHELGHGLHDWLTGGAASSSQGLGEGSGDYWGQSYSRSLGQWISSDPEYQWFFSWDGHNPFWSGRITNYTATYPSGLTGAIHTDGQIWATTLMRIYDILGREKVDKAFLEGLALTGSSSNQQDAAIAVRQAAIDMGYSCPDINVFTQEFTTTGYVMPPLNLAQFPPVVANVVACAVGIPATIAGNGSSLNWYADAALTNLLQTGDSLNTGQTNTGVYTYYVKYSDAACSVAPADTVTLTINPLPNINLGVDTTICDNSVIVLNSGSFSSYLWQDNSTTSTFTVDGNVTGIGTFTYWVEVTDGNGCVNSDSIVVNVSICTSINEEVTNTISIYPTPTTGILTISMNYFVPDTKIQLIDNLGRIVYQMTLKSNKSLIYLSKFSKGIYTLRLNTGSDIITKKIIKE
ncbi:MAG: hypothetical protein COX70_03205 [Flavobacteriales bacterium CG_4_10_14_0_2_um_filter_32_8]|nr:MAG: hypothetical protein COX70_03205 [Flavobacteriales bacterium CG_4_10_14_0_2_um_filter_32_8]